MSFTIRPVLPAEVGATSILDAGNASLAERMAGEFARLSETASVRQDFLAQAVGEGSSDPVRLLRAQGELAKFHTEMALHSALARKAVAVVETLVKT